MSDISCGVCSSATPNFVCFDCVKELKSLLETACWLPSELEVTVSRQNQFQQIEHRTRVGHSDHVMWNDAASQVARELAAVLGKWAGLLADARGLSGPDAGIAASWLIDHVTAVALCEWAPECYSEVERAVRAALRAIDRPVERVYVGPCGAEAGDGSICGGDLYAVLGRAFVRCPVCRLSHDVAGRREQLREEVRGLLGSAAEISRLLPWILGVAVTRKRIAYYARIGLLGKRDIRGETCYSVGDVIDAHVSFEARKQTA